MRKLLTIISILLLIGCAQKTVETNSFEIGDYKGFYIVKQLEEDWEDRDFYIIKNDSIIIKLKVPLLFTAVYVVGDTIK